MDLGVAYREITRVDVAELSGRLLALTDKDWQARPVRRAALAGGAHNTADSIVLRHHWEPGMSRRGFPTLQASLIDWAQRNGRDAADLLPVMQERNSETLVYTFRDWFAWQSLLLPVIGKVIERLVPKPRGVLTRALFVRLAPGATIAPHMDGQPLAARSHRIHVAISDSPDCHYRIGDTDFVMTPGVAYDFNNRWRHGVDNRGEAHRINLMLEYLPDPDWIYPVPIFF